MVHNSASLQPRSVRLLFPLAVTHEFEIWTYDVTQAYERNVHKQLDIGNTPAEQGSIVCYGLSDNVTHPETRPIYTSGNWLLRFIVRQWPRRIYSTGSHNILSDEKCQCVATHFKSCESRQIVRSPMAGEVIEFSDMLGAAATLASELDRNNLSSQ